MDVQIALYQFLLLSSDVMSCFAKLWSVDEWALTSIAYDRPSPKLLRFLGKHCRLTKYAPQQNNFVLFDSFWAGEPQPQPGKSASYDSISMRPLTARGAHPPRRALAHGNSKYGRPS